MPILHAFANTFPAGVGETKDLWGQWCVAAVATVAPALAFLGFAEGGMFGEAQAREGSESRDLLGGISTRWLEGLERRLQGRDWIAADQFTIADILMAGVLREVRHTDRLDGYPAVKAYFHRAMARPAWSRTLDLYAERLGADRAAIA